VTGGSAVVLATRDFRRRAVTGAAAMLGAAEDDIELVDGVARSRVDGRQCPVAELGCEGRGRFEKRTVDLSFCAVVAMASIDPDTGEVKLERYTGAYDVGRAVNPVTVSGLLEGAAAHGIGGVLSEESAFDASGQPLCKSFMDYLMPSVAQLPQIDSLVFEFPSRNNLLGVKGAAQNGIIATHAVVANAVADALGDPAAVTKLPLRPKQVYELLQAVAAR
jgi:CO/xanthine dehydrogenase Mo-binding subunit